MSGSLQLSMTTGEVFAFKFTWLDGDNQPVPFSEPRMSIRQEMSPTGKLIARLDESGTLNGKIFVGDPGEVQVFMSDVQTRTINAGYGFWDIYVTVYGNRVRLLYGTIEIGARVSEELN